MLKLARNILARQREIKSNTGYIKWQYIVELHNLQTQLQFTNTITI